MRYFVHLLIAEGQRLGPYEIVRRIGAGGMGEVWRARDPRLDRSVAIKVLPAGIANDSQLRARFEREARSISQLAHPNICTVFDVGDGYLVMELLDGEALADRLMRGPLPIEQVLRIGIEIASALHCAHRSGIIHRDLKPGNVMLTKGGAKLLDFGLAKPAPADTPPAEAATALRPLTEEGTIVGTYQYMSPEQLTGGVVDQRSDIFSFGALLYEMVTGRRAFEGGTRSSVITSILSREPPPLVQFNVETPPPLQRVVRISLAKDPEERWQSAHDIGLELKAIRDGGSSELPGNPPPRRQAARTTAIVLLIISALAAGYFLARRTSPQPAALHLGVVPPANSSLEFFTISPRGDMVAMVAGNRTGQSLWIRDLASDALHEVSESAGVWAFCFSPDGNSIAFVTKGRLFRTATSGGPSVAIADGLGFIPGLSWGASDTIVFARDDDGGISKISATAGGRWTKVTTIDAARQERHVWPSFLPDGKHFFYLVEGDQPSIRVGSVDEKERPRRVLENVGGNALYAAGQILFVRARTLLAQPFDLKALQVTEAPRVIAEQIADADFRHYVFSAAGDRWLGYSTFDPRSRLHLLDRSGKETAVFGDLADWVSVSWSPDARHAMVERVDGDHLVGKLWLADLTRGIFSEFESTSHAFGGLWSADGTEILYQTIAAPFIKRFDGSGQRQLPKISGYISSWAGDWVATEVDSVTSVPDVHAVSISSGKHIPIATSPEWENVATFTVDGRMIAYEAGGKIIVQPFPPTGAQVVVSSAAGNLPRWRGDGKELYYFDLDGHLIAVPIDVKDGQIEAGRSQTLFTVRPKAYKNRVPYDVSRDGQRFLVNVQDSYERAAHVVLNWTPAAQ